MKHEIILSLLTNEDTKAELFARKVLTYFYEQQPNLAPEFMNWWEPINKPVLNADNALAFWVKSDAIWRRVKTIKSSGGIYHTGVYGAGALKIRTAFNKKFDWRTFFIDLVKMTNAKYAYIHLKTPEEQSLTDLNTHVQDIFFLGAFDQTIKDGFHNLAWLNYFDSTHIKKIPLDALRKKAYRIDSCNDGILLQLSPSIDDVVTSLDNFSASRNEIKSIFPEDFFCKRLPMNDMEKDLVLRGLMSED